MMGGGGSPFLTCGSLWLIGVFSVTLSQFPIMAIQGSPYKESAHTHTNTVNKYALMQAQTTLTLECVCVVERNRVNTAICIYSMLTQFSAVMMLVMFHNKE